jgi:hypothetical protein
MPSSQISGPLGTHGPPDEPELPELPPSAAANVMSGTEPHAVKATTPITIATTEEKREGALTEACRATLRS